MNIDRKMRIETMAKSAVNSIYSSARFSHLSSDIIDTRFREVIARLPKGTPRHIRAYLDGMRDVHSSNLMAHDLEFCYLVDGETKDKDGNLVVFEKELVSVDRSSKRYYEALGIQPSELQKISLSSGFYYKGSADVYFASKT